MNKLGHSPEFSVPISKKSAHNGDVKGLFSSWLALGKSVRVQWNGSGTTISPAVEWVNWPYYPTIVFVAGSNASLCEVD